MNTLGTSVACVAGVRRGGKGKTHAREAREDRTREDRVPSPSRAHFDFPTRPATQAGASRDKIRIGLDQ